MQGGSAATLTLYPEPLALLARLNRFLAIKNHRGGGGGTEADVYGGPNVCEEALICIGRDESGGASPRLPPLLPPKAPTVRETQHSIQYETRQRAPLAPALIGAQTKHHVCSSSVPHPTSSADSPPHSPASCVVHMIFRAEGTVRHQAHQRGKRQLGVFGHLSADDLRSRPFHLSSCVALFSVLHTNRHI